MGLIFQFTPLHERQQDWLWKLHQQHYFNSRLYMRGSSCAMAWITLSYPFQFTPLHERQPFMPSLTSFGSPFQFTPLHERQRQLVCIQRHTKRISIHASTWEAANVGNISALVNRISIHASTWEAACLFLTFWTCAIFQFTPLHERQQWRSIAGQGKLYFNSRLYMRGSCKNTQFFQ